MYTKLERQQEYIHRLSPKITETIKWYTGDIGYVEINEILREGKSFDKTQKRKLDLLDKAFENVPLLEEELIVYRGISNRKNLKPIDKAFISTSLVYEESKKFINYYDFDSDILCCVLVITVSPGSKVLPLWTISRASDEHEILLDRNGLLYVSGTAIRDRTKLIYITYMSENSIKVSDEKQLERAERILDSQLIIKRIIEFLSRFPDRRNSNYVTILYKKITGEQISNENLDKIMYELNSYEE